MTDEPPVTEQEQQPAPKLQFDLNSVQPVQHVWVDRGLKLSCENAGHAHHEVWKRLPMQQ